MTQPVWGVVPGAQGRPVVLLHGASGNASSWALAAPAWRPAGAVAIDLPGRGASPGPPLTSVGAMAAWLVGELGRRGVERPVIVGHSMGGAVALQTALDHPDAVAGIVLVASAARLRVAPAILEAVARATDDAPFPLDAAFGPGTERSRIDAYAAAVRAVPAATSLADWRACDAFDVRDRLSEVRAPAVVVWGDEDRLTVPRFQRALADAIGARAVELPGAGHMVVWERDPPG